MDVALLRARKSGTLFCYCIGCGCTWLNPAEAHLGQPLDEVIPCEERAPHGVDPAEAADLAAQGLEVAILRTDSPFDWEVELEELNGASRGGAAPVSDPAPASTQTVVLSESSAPGLCDQSAESPQECIMSLQESKSAGPVEGETGPPARILSPGWVIAHVVAAAVLYRIDTYYLGQGVIAGLITAIMVVIGLVNVVHGLVGYRERLARGAVLIGLYATMMFFVVWTIRAGNREARTRADRVIASLHSFREAHGAYPRRLRELVPEFLPAVPLAKDVPTFGEFSYVWTEEEGGFLMYTELPPFGRPYYDLRNETWKYMD